MTILTCAALAACLAEPVPEPRIPTLPALPLTPVETAELAPLADIWPQIDMMMAVVYRPRSHEWYGTVRPAIAPLHQSRWELAAVSALSAALGDTDLGVRRNAAFVLAALARKWRHDQPRDIAAALIVALADDDAQVREFAARGLRFIPSDPALEARLTAAARDPSPRVRWAAIATLAHYDGSESMVAPIVDALEDPDSRTRYAATFAFAMHRILADSPALAERVVSELIARMEASDVADGHMAARQMVTLNLDGMAISERHLPSLTALASSNNADIRRLASTTIDFTLLRQFNEGAVDRDLLAARIDLHRANLASGDPETRLHAARSLRRLADLDSSYLADAEAVLAAETDYAAMPITTMARGYAIGYGSGYSEYWGVYYRDLCLPHDEFSIMGLRPRDDEHKVQDLLGEPMRISGSLTEDDGGPHLSLEYEYADLEIEIARNDVMRIATKSPTVIAGSGLRVGATRQETLAVFGIAPNPEALAARRFSVMDCDMEHETALHLDFSDDGRVFAMELIGYAP